MSRRSLMLVVLVPALLLAAPPAHGKGPFRYPEAKHKGGELKYLDGVPVLFVSGNPDEIGEQVAVLGVTPARRLADYPMDLLKEKLPIGDALRQKVWDRLQVKGEALLDHFPARHRGEFEAMVKAGPDRAFLLAANTMFDLATADFKDLFGCSSLIVGADLSKTGTPLFGRNMDFFALGYLHEYSLVLVVRPAGKRAFVSVGFPGVVGCFSGINAAGLALASHEIMTPVSGTTFNPKGAPFAVCYRRILEECATVDEAFRLLEKTERTTNTALAVCDRDGGAVFEVTPGKVVRRPLADGLGVCTNHFVAPALAAENQTNAYRTRDRLKTLQESAGGGKLGVAEVWRRLDAVHQGQLTIQAMVFEPAAPRLHLAMGKGPATGRAYTTLDVAALLKKR